MQNRRQVQHNLIGNNENDDRPQTQIPQEPITLRGDGNIVVFGLNNHFNTAVPNKLITRVAPEEYKATVQRINKFLRQRISLNAKLLFCGCLCLCCTLGMSLGPAVVFNRHCKEQLTHLLDIENRRLYNKLGLNWSLIKLQTTGPIATTEYVLQIEFLKKAKIYAPD